MATETRDGAAKQQSYNEPENHTRLEAGKMWAANPSLNNFKMKQLFCGGLQNPHAHFSQPVFPPANL